MTDLSRRSWLVDRFASRRRVPTWPPHVNDLAAELGDHTLNRGMRPRQPLTPAAVLVGCVDREDEMTVLFTRRTPHLLHHAGQISFPGGHIEPGDEGPIDTALRETEEEIGLDRRHVNIVGHLDTYITRTGFIVTPVVGVVGPPFTLAPDTHEVAEVFEVPLAHLLDPANHQICSADCDGVTRQFYAIPYRDYFIWGATAGMLINLFQILTVS